MRAGPLSDDRVIDIINEFFIPIEINVTRDGFPVESIPAMKHYQHVFQQNWRFEFGFANSSAVSFLSFDVGEEIALNLSPFFLSKFVSED